LIKSLSVDFEKKEVTYIDPTNGLNKFKCEALNDNYDGILESIGIKDIALNEESKIPYSLFLAIEQSGIL